MATFTLWCLTKAPAKSQLDVVAASSGGGPGERLRWAVREDRGYGGSPSPSHLVDPRGDPLVLKIIIQGKSRGSGGQHKRKVSASMQPTARDSGHKAKFLTTLYPSLSL